MTAEDKVGVADIGVVGMAVMGSNLARNMAHKGFLTALFNRTYAKTEAVMADHGHEGSFVPSQTVEEFVASLKRPRRIVMMVQAGGATDATIDSLTPLLEEGDILIAGGNSFFADTRAREAKLAALGLNFIGCGCPNFEYRFFGRISQAEVICFINRIFVKILVIIVFA